MEPLLKITTEPFKMTRISLQGRLIPTDNADIGRRRAIARRIAFQSRQGGHGGGFIPMKDIMDINRTFRSHSLSDASPSFIRQGRGNPSGKDAPPPSPYASIPASSSMYRGASQAYATAEGASGGATGKPAGSQSQPVPDTSYTVERGSFEFRVMRGDVTFIPPLVMTVITQWPDVNFEYTGGFHYVPPKEGTVENTLNLYT